MRRKFSVEVDVFSFFFFFFFEVNTRMQHQGHGEKVDVVDVGISYYLLLLQCCEWTSIVSNHNLQVVGTLYYRYS